MERKTSEEVVIFRRVVDDTFVAPTIRRGGKLWPAAFAVGEPGTSACQPAVPEAPRSSHGAAPSGGATGGTGGKAHRFNSRGFDPQPGVAPARGAVKRPAGAAPAR